MSFKHEEAHFLQWPHPGEGQVSDYARVANVQQALDGIPMIVKAGNILTRGEEPIIHTISQHDPSSRHRVSPSRNTVRTIWAVLPV